MALDKMLFLALVGYAHALPMQNLQGGGGMPKPPFMFVPDYQDCLSTKDMGTWVSWCLPSTIANGCPLDSFNMLKEGPMAFDGPMCDSVADGYPQPPYMDVPHYKDCLGHKDMGNWVSLCLPSTLANGCPLDSFNKLNEGPMAFDGPKCDSNIGGLPPTPEYLNIPHYKDCLGKKDMGKWESYCMPSTIANGCPLDSFNKLKDVFDGPQCDKTVDDLPPTPEYMNIPHYKECLGTKDMGLWVSYCMPSTIANGCPIDSFSKLKDVFDGPKCDETVKGMPPTPEYLNVPHYKDCLGHKDMGKWESFCMPSTVANGCPLDSYNKLKDVFDGPDCDDSVSDGMPKPEYMNVPHYKDCLGRKDMGKWESFCMPSTIANGCPLDSYNKLKDVFDGPDCDDSVSDGMPKPDYMNVPHYKDCLGHKDMGNWVSYCMPSTIANGCPLDSYNKLKDGPMAFDGPKCDDTVEVKPPTPAPRPAYLDVPHYKECLAKKDMGLWVTLCMPSTIADGCPLDSYNQLKEVFGGPDCDDDVEALPPTPEYLNVPHYKECLGHKDFGLWWEYCMPSTRSNGCPLDSFNKLNDVFDGSDCDEDVQDVPPTPEYLNIPHYKDCLGLEDNGLWSEYCMPPTRSNGCPQDSWSQINQVFDGKKCSST